MTQHIVAESEEHTFVLDNFSRITAKDKRNGGMLDSQSVHTLLFVEILRELRALRQLAEKANRP